MSSDLDPSSESMDKFIEALAKFSKSPQLHEVLLEDGEASGWCRIDNLTENPYISKTVWWQLFNDELRRTRTNNASFSRSFTEHYIDLEQLQALLTISSYGYKHAVFMNAGLPPITEEYAKELIASDWFTSRIARNWLNSGTAPESVIPILTAMADPGISRGKAVEHRSVRGWANIKLDPAELELTYEQRYERANTGGGYSVTANPRNCEYVEVELDKYGKGGWRMFVSLAANWDDSIAKLLECSRSLLIA